MDLQRFNENSPTSYNGMEVSFGIAPILNAIAGMAQSSRKTTWTLYLINIETLIRDRKSDITNLSSAVKDVITDCNVLSQYLDAYCKQTKLQVKPIVCFYFGHYENIPSTYLKDKLPKGTEERWKVRDAVNAELSTNGFRNQYEAIDVIFEDAGVKQGTWVHKELIKDLIHTYNGIQFRKTLMISHVPLDFHVYRFFTDFTILESYTGAFKKQASFGKKVFGEETIPFNKYTHLLFGDKWYLKQLCDRKQKKTILETADKLNWNIVPDKVVLKSIVDLHLPFQDLLIKPDI